MTLPEFDSTEQLLEFLYDAARAHFIANDERPQFTVYPEVIYQLDLALERLNLNWERVQDPNLGAGLQGPNYQLFADDSLDENELDVVRARTSGVG